MTHPKPRPLQLDNVIETLTTLVDRYVGEGRYGRAIIVLRSMEQLQIELQERAGDAATELKSMFDQTIDRGPASRAAAVAGWQRGTDRGREEANVIRNQPPGCNRHMINQLGCGDCAPIREQHYANLAETARSRAVVVPLINPPALDETRRIEVPAAGSHAPNYCTRRVDEQGNDCGAVVAWAHQGPGAPGWYHVDPEITDHEAEVTRP